MVLKNSFKIYYSQLSLCTTLEWINKLKHKLKIVINKNVLHWLLGEDNGLNLQHNSFNVIGEQEAIKQQYASVCVSECYSINF